MGCTYCGKSYQYKVKNRPKNYYYSCDAKIETEIQQYESVNNILKLLDDENIKETNLYDSTFQFDKREEQDHQIENSQQIVDLSNINDIFSYQTNQSLRKLIDDINI